MIRTTSAVLLLAAASTLLCGAKGGPAPKPAENRPPDPAITEAVEDEILVDDAVPFNRIDVETTDGLITLSGRVNNILAKERAARLAATVKGVEAVINRIQVEPRQAMSDSELRKSIRQALVANPATESYEIDVAVDDGEVRLSGTVSSLQEMLLAGKVAKSVKGVRQVVNSLDVAFETDRPPAEKEQDIKQALRWDTMVDDALIKVEVRDSEAVLTGTVGSLAEKTRAVNNAHVLGIDAVDASGLDVARWARDQDLQEGKYGTRPDPQIREAIRQALLLDPEVDQDDIQIKVADGVVTLRGIVNSLQAKRQAARVAGTRVAVRRIKNLLKVRPEQELTDREIAENVHQALLRDAYVARYDLAANVLDGIVYLSGYVDTWFEKYRAGEVVSQLKGVEDIRNNLYVRREDQDISLSPEQGYVNGYDWFARRPGSVLRDELELRESIEDQLFWSPFVDEDEVTVNIEDGVVILTGEVDSRRERQAATENAFEGGAKTVVNQLKVQNIVNKELEQKL